MEEDRKGRQSPDEWRNKEYDEKKLKEREEVRKLLEERRKERDAARQLYDKEFGNDEEGDPREREERRKQHESDILRRVEELVKQRKNKGAKGRRSSDAAALNPFKLFKLKKIKYNISVQGYFCDMIMKVPPDGEVARFYENFKEINPTTTFSYFPILYLDRFHSAPDLKVLLKLIDAQDSGGFTALHWAVQDGNIERIEMLLANGANTELKSTVAKHRPIDKLKIHSPHVKAAVLELFQKYQNMKDNSNANTNEVNNTRIEQHRAEVSEQFPFLELPAELQVMVLEQLSCLNLTRVERVCKYFRDMQLLSHHLADLPDMEVVTFAASSNVAGPQSFCQLTVMATPTVFHFGLIVGQYYKVPSTRGVDRVIEELIGRIEMFAKLNRTFIYDVEKLHEFLLTSWQMNRRIYILSQAEHSNNITIYVEEDSHFGVGVDFKSPLDAAPAKPKFNW